MVFCIFCNTTKSISNFHNMLCPCLFAASCGAILRPSWGLLGPSCRLLGPSWGVFVPSWGRLKPSWGILGQSWGILGPRCALLRPSWGHLGAILGSSCGHLGAILGFSGASGDARERPGGAIATDFALWAQAHNFQAQRCRKMFKKGSAEHGRSPLNHLFEITCLNSLV